MTAERDFRGGQACDFRLGHERIHECDWGGKATLDFGFVNATNQPRGNIAAVEDLDCDDFLLALLKFIELPLCGFRIQMYHPFAHKIRAIPRDNKLEPLDHHFPLCMHSDKRPATEFRM